MKIDSLANLRNSATQDPKQAIREVAKQFESLFMQELMKSMRQATVSSGMLDNQGTQLGTEMMDTEFAGKMSGLKGGLADAIARQLERQMGVAADAARARSQIDRVAQTTPLRAPAPASASAAAAAGAGAGAGASASASASASEFVAAHTEAAQRAEQASGIPAAFMVAQAAHETGWGKKNIRMADGSNSFNLFGIKAGADWKGPVARIVTTEYVDGMAQKTVQNFRAYASSDESFADYARLMKTSPRYRDVLAQATHDERGAQGFAHGLQSAGYATDPAYADKLGRVINTTLRLQRSMTA